MKKASRNIVCVAAVNYWVGEDMREYKDDFIEIEREAYKGKVTYDEKSKITIQLPLEPRDFESLLCLYNSEITISSEGLYRDRIKIERVKVNNVCYNWTKEKGYEIIYDCEVIKEVKVKGKKNSVKKAA